MAVPIEKLTTPPTTTEQIAARDRAALEVDALRGHLMLFSKDGSSLTRGSGLSRLRVDDLLELVDSAFKYGVAWGRNEALNYVLEGQEFEPFLARLIRTRTARSFNLFSKESEGVKGTI